MVLTKGLHIKHVTSHGHWTNRQLGVWVIILSKVPIWTFWLQLSKKRRFMTHDVMNDTSITP